MDALDSLLKYIQHSERLVVVSLTIAIAGLVCFAGERWQVFDFSGLPEWARPTALVVWTVSVVHVAIRTAMVLWQGVAAAAGFIGGIPQRRRRATYERPLIERLLATEGVEREMLCYALHRDQNHIWVEAGSGARWLSGLKQKGLVEMTDVGYGPVHYRIHSIAWNYMRKHPNRFINVLGWPDLPWTGTFDEGEAEKQIRKALHRG